MRKIIPCNYLIINLINNKVYIGKTLYPNIRWQQHKNAAANFKNGNRNKNSLLYRAMIKYGFEHFKYEVISQSKTEKDALDNEIILIDQYKSNIKKYGDQFGYNLNEGGQLSCTGYKAKGSFLKSIEKS